ncbi:MAG: pyruvate kinase [bacterium]
MRRTKIIATMGPATDSPEAVKSLILAGVNLVRLNFSHGSADEHKRRAKLVADAAKEAGRCVGILGDLQGPKIRIDRFADGRIQLEPGDSFILDAALDPNAGNQERVGLTYKQLVQDVSAGDRLILDDGRIVLDVEKIAGQEIYTVVVQGGPLSNNKGINRQGGGLSADALTEKDKNDIKLAAEIGVDYLAVSFPRAGEDMQLARTLMEAAGGDAGLVAKIERAEALEAIEDIINASDAIMVARGDLGVEIGDAELPAVQKDLIRKARRMNRVAITATQMMESMIENPIPTRAEVFDVANAVLDGTDAVMLSGETAVGANPEKVVETMGEICEAAERQGIARRSDHRINTEFGHVDEAIALAGMYIANHLGVKVIAALTESGSTAMWMSRISSSIPIYALTRSRKTMRRVSLYRGVRPVNFDTVQASHPLVNKKAVEVLQSEKIVSDGDLVILTKGDLMGVHGGTNALKVVRVGDLVEPT